MRWMSLALPVLILMACDQKSAPPAGGHDMKHTAPAASADKAKDPICGMMVDKAKSIKHTHEGADYYFCADACVAKFKAEPKKYAVHCACAKTSKKCDCGHCTPKGETCDCN
jgi:YHS domain-containing protein